MSSQIVIIRIFQGSRITRYFVGKDQHRLLAFADVCLAEIDRDLVSNQRVTRVNAQDRAMSDHTVLTIVRA